VPFPRPHVLVNVAMTADGKIDTVERRGARISSPEDVAAVDALRAEVDAVMVGGATFLAEDPRLTVRDAARIAERRSRGEPDQPRKVAVVSVLPETPAATSRFLHDGGGPVSIFTTRRSGASAIAAWRSAGADVTVSGGDVAVAGADRVDLGAALSHLAGAGVRTLLVEGGGTLIAALFGDGLVDELRQYVAPFVVGGRAAPTPFDGEGLPFSGQVALELTGSERLGVGIALRYMVRRPTA